VDPDFYLASFGKVHKTANAEEVWDILDVYPRPGWRQTGAGLLKNAVAYGADSFVLVSPFR
jgi:hypothetical protein